MLRLAKAGFFGFLSFLVVLISSPLLFWLGRSTETRVGELVIDPELDSEDEGVDVDLEGL